MRPGAWTLQAKCRGIDPELFYPERGESSEPGKKICRHCDVWRDCLSYALANDERYGIWGGTTDRARRRLRRDRSTR